MIKIENLPILLPNFSDITNPKSQSAIDNTIKYTNK